MIGGQTGQVEGRKARLSEHEVSLLQLAHRRRDRDQDLVVRLWQGLLDGDLIPLAHLLPQLVPKHRLLILLQKSLYLLPLVLTTHRRPLRKVLELLPIIFVKRNDAQGRPPHEGTIPGSESLLGEGSDVQDGIFNL